jgi:hypothetical protein
MKELERIHVAIQEKFAVEELAVQLAIIAAQKAQQARLIVRQILAQYLDVCILVLRATILRRHVMMEVVEHVAMQVFA